MTDRIPKQLRSTRARAGYRWRLWLGWVAATTAGGAAGALLGSVASRILREDAGSGMAWIALLAMPSFMAVTQWRVVRRSLAGADGQRVRDAALRWRVAALAGCIPALGLALHGFGGSSTPEDVLTWHAAVALFAGFLSASAQADVVAEAFGRPAGPRYLSLTVVSWTIAWPLWIASVNADAMTWVVELAWACVPGAVIGALSGVALLPLARPPQSSVRHIAVIGPFPLGGADVAWPQEVAQVREREAVSSVR